MERCEGGDDAAIQQTVKESRVRKRYTFPELLSGMTPDREHPLEDDGPKGEEVI